jgi:Ca-activated chloride channel homolog
MSDGENNEGISADEFVTFYNNLPAEVKGIRTFSVLFGDAEEQAMQELATLTNGRMFNAQSESLAVIFKQIRGYQ